MAKTKKTKIDNSIENSPSENIEISNEIKINKEIRKPKKELKKFWKFNKGDK